MIIDNKYNSAIEKHNMIIRRVGYRELRYPPTTECWACITVAQNSSTRGAQTIHPSNPKRRMQTLF